MGFLSRFQSAWHSNRAIRATIDDAEQQYQTYLLTHSDAEPIEFMLAAWRGNMTAAGQSERAARDDSVKLYGCISAPLCVRLLASEMCSYVIAGYSETAFAAEWNREMKWFVEAAWQGDANTMNKLNALFSLYNPRAYQAIVENTGRPPFFRESRTGSAPPAAP